MSIEWWTDRKLIAYWSVRDARWYHATSADDVLDVEWSAAPAIDRNRINKYFGQHRSV